MRTYLNHKTMSKHRIVSAIAIALVVNSSCGTLDVVITDGRGGAPSPVPRSEPRGEAYASYRTLKIPPGHLPPPGQCKIWYPGKPPGHQGPPMSCDAALRKVSGDAWVISRAGDNTKILEVRERKAGPKVEIIIRKFLID